MFFFQTGYWKGTGVYQKIPEADNSLESEHLEEKYEDAETYNNTDQDTVVAKSSEENLVQINSENSNLKASTSIENHSEERSREVYGDNVNDHVETFENSQRETVKKSVSFRQNGSKNPKTEKLSFPLKGEGDGSRQFFLELSNDNDDNDVEKDSLDEDEGEEQDNVGTVRDVTVANKQKSGACWDIEMSGVKGAGTGKMSKRMQALRQARTQSIGERYVPPKVLVSANQIAERKVLDLKRW